MWSISFGMEKSRIHFFTAWKAQLFVGVLAAAAGVSALAQQQAKVAAAEEPLQEIIVTGSRIAAPNAAAPADTSHIVRVHRNDR